MRNALATLVLLPAIALAAPDLLLADFEPAALQESLPAQQSNETLLEDGSLELLKRQTGCASGYAACNNLNEPGLCCRTSQVCSADAAGHVACCPLGSACTGTIEPVQQQTAPVSVTSTTTTSPFVIASTTTGAPTASTDNPFVQQTGSAASYIHSTVSNSFFPFPYIPTTYTNAAACSSAYTSCQSDAASCTAALANGQQGVTISAPNGGATITAIASLGQQSAASICSSLSQQACSGLQVEACQAFGGTGEARTMCGDMYRVGAGVALGIAGQLLR
ncbi:hypothetical protein BU26DRAFT_545278 [Trematosphaeria pertusa]|uniref:Uncharacterized protein n=1 Tax=Trematosphaeria pertusa TaxID=390896 RepID=A0A6A6IZ80_9PLEO|nr:uncharacterized protein BU26DRAFT_545278 [Trematosphaeria pertusa]KAF2255734.1 hypothetical protein BU26DRAFT_545278 [Trematosphaeria pertusa]